MIKKLDTDKYRVTVEMGYDVDGKRRRKIKIIHGTKAEAKKKESEMMNEYYHIGKKIRINDYTFSELSERYLKKCKTIISKSTYNLYVSYLERINTYIGNYKIKDITTFELDRLYTRLREGKREPLSNKTLSNYRKLINAIFRQAIRWEFIEKNPNENTEKFKREREKTISIYSIEEVKKLFKALETESIKTRAIITLAVNSGARKGEICALRWSDIDLDNHVMKISKTLKVIDGKADESTAKTESSRRKVVLSECVIKVLIEYKEWQQEYIKKNKDKWKGTEDRVFTSLDGRFMNPVSCNTCLYAVIKRHGLKPITFHGLRHTCASVLINQGVDIKTISSRLGHAHCSMTLDVYTHIIEGTKTVCADKFDELLKDS